MILSVLYCSIRLGILHKDGHALVGHLDAVLFERGVQLLGQTVSHRPVIVGGGPCEQRVVDMSRRIAADHQNGRRIMQDIRNPAGGVERGFAHCIRIMLGLLCLFSQPLF